MELVTCPNCGRTRQAPEHLEESLAPIQLGPYCCRGCAIGLECTCEAEEALDAAFPSFEEESAIRNSLLEEPRRPREDKDL